MSPESKRRFAAALLVSSGVGLAACGGGGDAFQPPGRADVGAASTLLDDDGHPMPSDPAAVPAGTTAPSTLRHATAAQAADLQRALGASVLDIAVTCCGERDVDAAIVAATGAAAGTPLAVLLRGSDTASALAAAERLNAAGIERVWIVAEQ